MSVSHIDARQPVAWAVGFTLLCLLVVFSLPRRSPLAPPSLVSRFARMPLVFVERSRTSTSDVCFTMQHPSHAIGFTSRGLVVRLGEPRRRLRAASPVRARKAGYSPRSDGTSAAARHGESGDRERAWIVALDFAGPCRTVNPLGEDPVDTTFSFFTGERSHWQTGLSGYRRIRYSGIWPGIDLVYQGVGDQLKYEFQIRPGADPSAIRMRVRGATRVEVSEDGRLTWETPVGALGDDRPFTFQGTGSQQRGVDSSHRILKRLANGDVEVGFRIGPYDPTQPLTIDPAVLFYCGYVGGAGEDYVHGLAVDAEGSAFVAGSTTSSEFSFPVNVGPDTTQNSFDDGFVAKVRADGLGFSYCGYIGGSGSDDAQDVAVDSSGNAYVVGRSDGGLATTVGPDLTYNGGYFDTWVAKVNPAGNRLLYCGYIGGDASEYGLGIDVDDQGRAYVVGETYSAAPTFPALIGPDLQANGERDAFIARVRADGTGLEYAGFIGGASSEGANDVVVDDEYHAYLCGTTYSDGSSFPVVVGPSLNHRFGAEGFVAKVDPTGSGLVYCGYIGGFGFDSASAVAVDSSGAAYVCGTSDSVFGFPLVAGPDLTLNGLADAFLAHIRPDGLGFLSCGYLGGSGYDAAEGIALGPDGAVHLTGHTESTSATFPLVGGPDLTHNGFLDGFVLKLRPGTLALEYCGYLGGSGVEVGRAIALDSRGSVYVGGYTTSPAAGFPVKNGPDLTYGGGPMSVPYDGFVACIQIPPSLAPELAVSPLPGGRALLSWTDSNPNLSGFDIERRSEGGSFQPRAAVGSGLRSLEDTGLLAGANYTYRIRARNGVGASPPSREVTVQAMPGIPAAPTGLLVLYASGPKIGLSWTDNSTNELGFHIERAVGNGNFVDYDSTGANVGIFFDFNLQPGTTYRYRVSAYNDAGRSAGVESSAVTVPAQIPDAPTGITAIPYGSRTMRLFWNDHSSDESGFQLYRKEGTGNFAVRQWLPANVTECFDSVLPSRTYTYRITAYNTAGESPAVTSLPATTLQDGRLVVKPKKVTFPRTRSGRNATRFVTLQNTGLGPLWIRWPRPQAPFGLAPMDETGELFLEPRQLYKLALTFSPTARGSAKATLLIDTDLGDLSIPLKGTAR